MQIREFKAPVDRIAIAISAIRSPWAEDHRMLDAGDVVALGQR